LIEGIETAFELSVAIIERLGNEKQTFEQQEQNYGSNSNGYTYGYGGSNTNSNSGKILSTIEMKKKIMKYFQKKYNMTDDEFIFLYDGLYSFIDNFEGKSTITEIIEEYKESAFYN
jgi:hypothetical protein